MSARRIDTTAIISVSIPLDHSDAPAQMVITKWVLPVLVSIMSCPGLLLVLSLMVEQILLEISGVGNGCETANQRRRKFVFLRKEKLKGESRIEGMKRTETMNKGKEKCEESG